MTRIFTLAYWQTVGWAVLRTTLSALVTFTPVIVTLISDPQAALPGIKEMLLTVGLVFVVAVVTMLRGLPETDSGPWWAVASQRAVRQFGQYVAAATVGGALLTDFDWRAILGAGVASAVATFVLAALSLVPSLAAADDLNAAAGSDSSFPATDDEVHDDAQDGSTEGTEGLDEGIEYEDSTVEAVDSVGSGGFS